MSQNRIWVAVPESALEAVADLVSDEYADPVWLAIAHAPRLGQALLDSVPKGDAYGCSDDNAWCGKDGSRCARCERLLDIADAVLAQVGDAKKPPHP